MPDRAKSLTDSQLLVLSTLVYRLDRAGVPERGMSLSALVESMRAAVLERQAAYGRKSSDTLSQLMTYGDWLTVFDNVQASSALRSLEVAAFDIDERGARSLVLADADNQAYVVFAGTGAGEWTDNADAACGRESSQQMRALAWFLHERATCSFETVTVCGHSKGGNKALYVTVRAGDAVDRAVAFDAQGFSREFVQVYGDEILANTHKITCYSLDNDYVNGLLSCIALHSRRIYVDGSHVEHIAAYHSPFSMFAPYKGVSGHVLELGGQVPQGDFGRVFRDFSAFVVEEAPHDEYEAMCRCVCAALENVLVPHVADDVRATRAVEIGRSEGFALFLGYLSRFFESSSSPVGPADVIGLLLPQGKRGKTLVDDIAIGALETVSGLLRQLTRK